MASKITTLKGMMNHAVFGLQTISTMSPRKNIQIISHSYVVCEKRSPVGSACARSTASQKPLFTGFSHLLHRAIQLYPQVMSLFLFRILKLIHRFVDLLILILFLDVTWRGHRSVYHIWDEFA